MTGESEVLLPRVAAAAGGAQRDWRGIGWRLAAGVILLGLWQAAAVAVGTIYVATPVQVAVRLVDWFASGMIFIHLAATAQQMVIGILIGTSLGVVAGLLLGRLPTVAAIVEPYLYMIYSLPKAAMAPLFILWFGIGLTSKIVLVCVVVFFLTFYNAYRGARETDRQLIDAVRIMGGSRRDLFVKVIAPSAVMWVIAGVRLSVPYALIASVIGEMIAAKAGLGFLIMRASQQFDTVGIFAALTILMLVSVALEPLITLVERRSAVWTTLGSTR